MLDQSGMLTVSGLPQLTSSGASQPTLLREQVAVRLRQDILSCQLLPGAILSEAQIADRYGVKKAPVRSALISEERGGLVHAIPRHGWQIEPITPRSISDVFMLRRALEPVLVEADLTHADRERLETALRVAEALSDAKDTNAIRAGWRLERETLTILAAALGNALLSATLSDLWDRTERCMTFAVCKGAKPYVASPRADLVRTLERGDRRGARHALAAALERQYECLTRVVMGMTDEIRIDDVEGAAGVDGDNGAASMVRRPGTDSVQQPGEIGGRDK